MCFIYIHIGDDLDGMHAEEILPLFNGILACSKELVNFVPWIYTNLSKLKRTIINNNC